MLNWNEVLRIARECAAPPPRRDERSEAEWRDILTPERYYVMREHGTERAFSSQMCSVFGPGQYACAACDTLLFDAAAKFESGTGWPSFGAPVADNVIAYKRDSSFGMTRVEVLCAVCDGHLGHVFPDGPAPTGLRYCINALSLDKREDAA